MFKKSKSIVSGVLLAFALMNSASANPEVEKLTGTLMKSMPGLKVDALRPTPVPGLYELVTGSDVAYVTADGTYMIQGMLYNVPDRKNLTESTLAQSRVKALQTIDPASLLVFPANGKAKHTITVFTDPSCPFCIRLHSEIQKLNELGVTVKYALYARNGNNTLTGRQLSEVLCSKDPKAELGKFFGAPMRDAKGSSCTGAEGLEQIARVAPKVGLKGTPHIVSDSGVAFSGYQPAAELVRNLQGS